MITLKREFIETLIFSKRWKELSLTDNDLHKLQSFIMQNPSAGDVIEGTGGTIKLRYALPNIGKSGGIRVIYIDIIKAEHIHLITCYPKYKQNNLSDSEKNTIKEVVKRIIKNERGGV